MEGRRHVGIQAECGFSVAAAEGGGRKMEVELMNNRVFGFRASLLCGAAILSVTAFASTAVAQSEEEASSVADIVVTGSRIPRPDVVSNSPVSVVSSEEIARSRTGEVEQVLNTLPQVVAGFGAQSNNPGNGTATVDLRNLGAVRTLVLVNGRRVVGSGNDGVVDLNIIPPSLVSRVEVATGGASAVYGSDAMAGVVNFIMKDDFEGAELGVQYGVTQHGDSARVNVDFTVGTNFADGRGNIVGYLNYFDREQTTGAARDYTSEYLVDALDANGNPVLVPGGNAVTPQGTLVAPGLVGLKDPFGTTITGSGIFFAPEGWRAYQASDGYNDRPVANIQLPMERFQANTHFKYDLTDAVRAYGEVSFARTAVNSTLGALPMGSSGFIPGFQLDLRNPYLPGDLRNFLSANLDQDGDNLVPVNINRRIVESGPRTNDQTRNFYRTVFGLEGTLANGMSWDIFYNYGRNELTEVQGGGLLIDNFAAMFLTNPNDPYKCANGDPKCVTINPFGLNSLTQEMRDYYGVTLTNRNEVEQKQFGASIAGTLFTLPAGDLGIAVGIERREESAQFNPDALYIQGKAISRSAGMQPTGGGYDVSEIYAEAYVPLIADRRGIEMLAFEGGIRFSDYSTAGAVTSYKYGGEYSPMPGLKFRGLAQRAVRAPNVTELYSGQTNTAPVATDFCNAGPGRTAAERAFCLQLGVPTQVIDVFQQENTQIRIITGGNPNLGVETSDTWSLGLVYQPHFLNNATLTLDYYDIQIQDAIANFGGGLPTTIAACQADMRLDNPFCVPLRNRNPDGQLQDLPMLNQNIADIASKGVDFRVDYRHSLDSWGDLTYFIAGSYLLENTIQGSPVVNPIDCAGYVANGGCASANPEWRFTQRLTWEHGPASVSLRHRYIGEVTDGRYAAAIAARTAMPKLAKPVAPATHYVDLSGDWEVNERVTLYGGIDNLLNQEPPYLHERQTYDVLGRRFNIGVRARF